MKRPLCFIDTETTNTSPHRRAWEVAYILRRPGREEERGSWLVEHDDLDMANADPDALNVGRFYERHPQVNPHSPTFTVHPEREVMRQVERVTRHATLIGSNVPFDKELLGDRMRAHGFLPNWHYKPECIATLARAVLLGRRVPLTGEEKSDDLSRLVGVDPARFDRHTAMGDCEWSAALWDACHDPIPAEPIRPVTGALA
ncbi:hypothetical protein [Micromonospora sp. RV43]|uniref:3'-5' exonuclease n=1 Tax=Micromonospora sp. RV43 TaxID=1661387 RepID=UPI00064C14AC|nr:hypothetical protein [Micromonospora sp. RV43]